MKNKTYEDLIGQLKQIEPEPINNRKITENIIRHIETLPQKKRRFIVIHANEKQWTLFSGVRVILTTAAVFLIAFLIFQQVEINRKLDSLEANIVNSKEVPDLGTIRGTKLQKVFKDHIISNASLKEGAKKTDFIYMNKKSLNYLMETINQLEKENSNYRQLLEKYSKDSIKKFYYK